MLTGSNAGHAANAIFPDDKTLVPQKRGLKAIFARFLTAANKSTLVAFQGAKEVGRSVGDTSPQGLEGLIKKTVN